MKNKKGQSRVKFSAAAEHKRSINKILTREFLREQYLTKGLTASEISIDTGFHLFTILNRIARLKIGRKNKARVILPGQVFGKLHVLYRLKRKKQKTQWQCRCECGNEKACNVGALIGGKIKSCGCDAIKKGRDSWNWKGFGQINGTYWKRIVDSSLKRGHKFDILISDAWDKFVKQSGKCALTGWEITLSESYLRSVQTASLDRIDSSIGYTVDNIQWVHKDLNKLKRDWDEEYLLKMANAMIEWNKSNK